MKIRPQNSLALLAALGLSLSACTDTTPKQSEEAQSPMAQSEQKPAKSANPFFAEYNTPYDAPPFDKIKTEHYKPAFEEAMRINLAEIDAIINNPEAPTFDNTIAAMEAGGALLSKVARAFFTVSGADTTKELQNLQREISPKLAQHGDQISLNPDLFKRVKALYEKKDALSLTAEQAKLLEDQYKSFVRAGALLKGESKERLKAINAELSKLSVEFGQNLLAETNGFELILDKNQLDGLPQDIIAAAATAATQKMSAAESDEEKARYKDKYLFTPHRSSMYPFLTYSTERKLREQLYTAYVQRGDNDNAKDNKKIASEIAALRAERAQLLGYDTHADYVLEETMAKTPEAVYDLLMQLWRPALARAKTEVKDMQAMIKSEGKDFELAAWDWWHYSEKVRQAKYALDEASIKPYLSLDNVLAGAFEVANQLWGLSFKERFDVPVYHDDVRVWEVTDKDGSYLGLFMGDYYTRSSKRGGAWMMSLKSQSNFMGKVRPIVTNTCNFPPPVGDLPSLLSFEQVTTLFHEFGHGLHGLVTNTTYPSQSGTAGPRDYTEFPAQILEHWAGQPQLLKKYAKHFETGDAIPDELIAKLQKAAKFNQGFANTEYLAASILDMDWHTLKTTERKDSDAFEQKTLERIGLIDEIAPRYRSTYFAHIFSGGYAASYYGYVWSAVLDSDGFAAFEESGDIFNQELAQKYRENILEAGSTEEAMTLYKKFRGRKPEIAALLKVRGLDGSVDEENEKTVEKIAVEKLKEGTGE